VDYYINKLSAEKLKRCYDLATERVKQYLEAELNHVLSKIRPSDIVLELGCGYGRIIPALASKAKHVTGIDNSSSSVKYGKMFTRMIPNCKIIFMDAVKLLFDDNTFDIVVCIQNGISAFHTDPLKLLKESMRVTKHGGIILYSGYSEKFWDHRLEWFRLQSEAGLLGEIDYEKTGNGSIICKDGFSATTFGVAQFLKLAAELNAKITITEIDDSSIFCEIDVK